MKQYRTHILSVFAFTAIGCQATPVVPPVNNADKTPNEAPKGAVGEPSSRPATVEKVDAGSDDKIEVIGKPEERVETSRQPIRGFSAQTVVASGPLPLVYWPETGATIRVVNAKGDTVGETFVDKRQIVRVTAGGAFAGDKRLSPGRLAEGTYQIILVADGSGEVRQERRNMPPREGDDTQRPPR